MRLGGGVFFSKIEDSHLCRFSCWGSGGVGGGGHGAGGGYFFSKIEDIHFSCIDFHVGGGLDFFGFFFQK